MSTEVILPKVDMDMTTGMITRWHVADGAVVKKGQAIFDIETDKAAMEIEAPVAGVIRIGDARPGDVFAIGTPVAQIYGAGETPQAFVATPRGAVFAPQQRPQPGALVFERAGANGATQGSGLRATPLARQLSRREGVRLEAISGSGPLGRIGADDVRRAKAQQAHQGAAAALEGEAVRALYGQGTYDIKPLDGMRRAIARRVTLSKQLVPHFYLSATCTIDALLALRKKLNAKLKKHDRSALGFSINDFMIRALGLALAEVPEANVTFTEEGLLQHHHSDVGVAVAVEGGLYTPILRHVEAKSLKLVSAEMRELAGKARGHKLQPFEYRGGSAAISNLGMFGVDHFAAIINPPQTSVLAIGAAVERFVPVKKKPVLKTQVTVTLSCDHRAIDGAVGARLLQAFRGLLEEPAVLAH